MSNCIQTIIDYYNIKKLPPVDAPPEDCEECWNCHAPPSPADEDLGEQLIVVKSKGQKQCQDVTDTYVIYYHQIDTCNPCAKITYGAIFGSLTSRVCGDCVSSPPNCPDPGESAQHVGDC